MKREEDEILELIWDKISKHDYLDIALTLTGTSTLNGYHKSTV